MEILEEQEAKPTRTKKVREAKVSPERLEAMLRGEHVLPFVRDLFGQERDNNVFPTLITCPSEITLPAAFSKKIAQLTTKTLNDTRERGCLGYLESADDSLNEVRFHLERTSKKFAYYVRKNDRPHINWSIDDLMAGGVEVPLIKIHTHPDVLQPGWTAFISVPDIISFLDARSIPFDVTSHSWGATLLVKCQEFFKGPIYSWDNLWRNQLERLIKIWDYYRDNMASSERHSAKEDFLAAICGQYGIAYYTSNRFNEDNQPLIEPKTVTFKRVNPLRRLKDVEEIGGKI
jgi:hypothetical protein